MVLPTAYLASGHSLPIHPVTAPAMLPTRTRVQLVGALDDPGTITAVAALQQWGAAVNAHAPTGGSTGSRSAGAHTHSTAAHAGGGASVGAGAGGQGHHTSNVQGSGPVGGAAGAALPFSAAAASVAGHGPVHLSSNVAALRAAAGRAGGGVEIRDTAGFLVAMRTVAAGHYITVSIYGWLSVVHVCLICCLLVHCGRWNGNSCCCCSSSSSCWFPSLCMHRGPCLFLVYFLSSPCRDPGPCRGQPPQHSTAFLPLHACCTVSLSAHGQQSGLLSTHLSALCLFLGLSQCDQLMELLSLLPHDATQERVELCTMFWAR